MLMILKLPRLKEFKVSIIVKQKDEIKKQKEKAKREDELKIIKYQIKDKNSLNLIENMKYISSPKYLNLFSVNNITYKTLHQNISNSIIDKRYIEPELLKNMYVQTTLSSSLLRKKFLTPFQIMHSKNNSLRDILHYSKNNDKITKSEKKIKSRLLTIRSYSTKNDNRITNENIFIKNDSNSMSKIKNLRSNNSHKIILRKVIKQNKQNRNILPASNYLSTTMPLIKNINGKNHNNNYLRSVGNEKYLLRYKSIEKMNFKPITQFKANCYYNKLKLKKVDNILKKYSYADS